MSAQQIPLTQEMELYKKPVESVNTPMGLLNVALQNNAAIDVIERLAALQEKALIRDAEIQFNEAMNAVQSELGRIAPNLENPQTKSKYASYAALDRALRPIYVKYGFSLSFDSGDSPSPDTVRVICYVSHRGGHTRKYTGPPMPADGKGAKGGDVMTKTHATGAAMSYGMRYMLKYIFNIAIGEDDNDGNGASGLSDLSERLEWIANCKDFQELDKIYKTSFRLAHDARDEKGKKSLIEAKNFREKQLRGGQ